MLNEKAMRDCSAFIALTTKNVQQMEVLIRATEKNSGAPNGPNLQEPLPATKILCCEDFATL